MADTSTLQSHAQRDFLNALTQKSTDAESTDFTIINGGQEFKIHKVILSLHSKYFDRLFKSEYKETSQNRISLIGDPPLAVSCMVQYFYHFSYKPEPDTYTEPRPSISPTPTQADPLLPSLVQVHAYIYTLAEKYDIPGLKRLAKANFTSTAHHMLQ
ncbi:hypothetical protein M409DRAFT_21010 [Zasmidium cellare ATCC 36951]|uniref:BTB domain-containing protein n=1 Tax=Zasmidium cellare ATCC 36951 TaxID=1080233 RepID=A0A6A6CT96_ZASCE|nr:uncharacterized protein M409DRAFT_21010 [Zasmidium cellare ATCC 36951]KAF2168999.1 hypothetical protein M409DRAFT_21010 [Zasmidium cellare ATCC 36951]